MFKMLEEARAELTTAVQLIGSGNPAAHKVQCALAESHGLLDEALELVDEAAAMLAADHAALPHLSTAAALLTGAIGELAQGQGRAAADTPAHDAPASPPADGEPSAGDAGAL